MYIIHKKQLIQVDTGSDILEHYGVKGMHWDTKKGKRITAAVNKTEGSGLVSAYGNVKEMRRYENSKYDSTMSKRKNNYSRSL